MYTRDKNTVEKPVVTREMKLWRLRVNAAIRLVRSHFGASHFKVPLTCRAEKPYFAAPHTGKIPTVMADAVPSKENQL